MGENSAIEWTKHTFNPWIGCQKVGPGCDHCYAETWDARGLHQAEPRWGAHAKRTRTSNANWRKPLAWDRAAASARERHRVFCASLADVFDNHHSILPEWRSDLWARSMRDQCAEAGVAFHFKQWGEWASVSEISGPGDRFKFSDHAIVRRVGKAVAGRLLDGVTWDQMPGAAQ